MRCVCSCRDKLSESDDKQSCQYASDCVSSVYMYRLLSELVLVARFMHNALNLNMSLIPVLTHVTIN